MSPRIKRRQKRLSFVVLRSKCRIDEDQLRRRHGIARRQMLPGMGEIGLGRVDSGNLKKSGVSPVCWATLANIRGPISSPSWKANVKSVQPARVSAPCEPVRRLIDQPSFRSAERTSLGSLFRRAQNTPQLDSVLSVFYRCRRGCAAAHGRIEFAISEGIGHPRRSTGKMPWSNKALQHFVLRRRSRRSRLTLCSRFRHVVMPNLQERHNKVSKLRQRDVRFSPWAIWLAEFENFERRACAGYGRPANKVSNQSASIEISRSFNSQKPTSPDRGDSGSR